MSEDLEIDEFRIEDIPLSCTWIIVGAPGSGKTTLIENICYYRKHLYPTARCFLGSETAYKEFCEIFGKMYCSNYYNEKEEEDFIRRQKSVILENGVANPMNYSINVIDDASDDPKVYKTKIMQGLFKLGSQHWQNLLLVGVQYSIDFPPSIRMSVSYVALFREPNELNRKKLYNNFGGICGDYKTFSTLLEGITGEYTCMVIKCRSQSNKIRDNVFYLKTRLNKKWKFGCAEYKKWAVDRYNPNYVEQVVM